MCFGQVFKAKKSLFLGTTIDYRKVKVLKMTTQWNLQHQASDVLATLQKVIASENILNIARFI